jgi:hypothetical protein
MKRGYLKVHLHDYTIPNAQVFLPSSYFLCLSVFTFTSHSTDYHIQNTKNDSPLNISYTPTCYDYNSHKTNNFCSVVKAELNSPYSFQSYQTIFSGGLTGGGYGSEVTMISC